MQHVLPHELSRDDARRLLREACEHYAARFAAYAPQVVWCDDDHVHINFEAKGLRLRGAIDLTEHACVLKLEVPLLLRPLRGLALAVIEAEASRRIAAFRAGHA